MKHIVVIGWDKSINNMGDIMIMDAACFLLGQNRECVISRVDWKPSASGASGKSIIRTAIDKSRHFFLTVLKNAFGFNNNIPGRLNYHIIRKVYETTLSDYYNNAMRDADAVVVAGGGVLKFLTQNHSFYTELAISTAAKIGIPMMFNAIGIEHYSDTDVRCLRLIDTLNNSTVKCITIRDDYETLKTRYVTNDSIIISKVGDSALWIPECYGIRKREPGEIIGINLLREGMFKDYGYYNITVSQQYELYEDIIRVLEKKGYQWKLFCNGVDMDYKFGLNLLRRTGNSSDKIERIPESTADYIKQLAGYRGVIAGRMHTAIAAYSLDIPMAAFAWGIKIHHFAETAGVTEYVAEGDNITGDGLVLRLERAMKYGYDKQKRNELKISTQRMLQEFYDSI